MSQLISSATHKNWERMGIAAAGVRLTSRANKTSSQRIVFPVEYFHHKKNIPLVQKIVDHVKEHNLSVENILYAAALRCLEHKDFIVNGKTSRQNVRAFIEEYQHLSPAHFPSDLVLPFDESDLLGLLYQCLQSEGKRNRDGIYYTSFPVAEILLRDTDISQDRYFLDPCCGSGNLLLHISGADPKNLFGIDSDPLAVMIAKCNMIMNYPGIDFSPRIFHRDFLETDRLFARSEKHPLEGILFNYIITNPPWGAVSHFGDDDFAAIKSNESFSAFMVKSMRYLSENGKLRFLLPESFLHIKTHSGIRSFILKQYHIEEIRRYPHSFSGVSTKFIDVTITKNRNKHVTAFNAPNHETILVDTSVFAKNRYSVFSIINREDSRIIDYVNNQGIYDLSGSVFGLGIVTGDNKSKLFAAKDDNLEAIYSGKEVSPYRLLKAQYFIRYCREQFQQAAKESIYRTSEKLAYKFISHRLVFAYDNTQSLFLNSANLLIPNIKGMNIKTVLAFLNSELYQFVYQKQFPDIKVLKGNLTGLPFPAIDEETDKKFIHMTDMILSGQDMPDADNSVYEIFHVNNRDRKYIKEAMAR